MAHVVRQGARRARIRPVAGVVLLTLCLLAPAALLLAAAGASRAQAAEDDIVPGGSWLLRVKVTQETQRDAIAQDGQRHPLVDYLAQHPGLAGRLSGEVTRSVTATETLIGFGISDTWNLNLSVPYLSIRQDSTLGTDSGDPALAAVVDTLKSRTVSGVGNPRLMSLHRPVFTDSSAIVLGWGFSAPGGPQQSDYSGITTLDTRVPYQTLAGTFQFTFYPPRVNRARFDLRATFDLAFDTHVNTATERRVPLHPPNTGTFALNWEQEFERAGYGISLRHQATTQSFLDGEGQGDMTKETRLGIMFTYGNLSGLEQRALAFPWQAGVQADHMVLGFNVPASSRLTLFLRTYF